MQATTQAKTSDVSDMRLPIKKNKVITVYCEFYCDFGWFFMDFEKKQAKHGQFYCVKTG